MAIDTTPSTVATNALQAIPFSSLIGGPLDACIKAQALAAKTSWEFIDNVGLTIDPVTQEKKAVNVTFQYNNNGQLATLVVPLIIIVPIPYLAINTVNIDFTANISAAASSSSETSSNTDLSVDASATASFGIGPFSVSVTANANYSSKQQSKAAQNSSYSVEYTMGVQVAGGQADMPAGLMTILNILQGSIASASDADCVVITPAALSYNQSQNATLQVAVKDTQGLFAPGTKVVLQYDQSVFQLPTIIKGTTPTNAQQQIAEGRPMTKMLRGYLHRYPNDTKNRLRVVGQAQNGGNSLLTGGATPNYTTITALTDGNGNVTFGLVLLDSVYRGTALTQSQLTVTADVPKVGTNPQQFNAEPQTVTASIIPMGPSGSDSLSAPATPIAITTATGPGSTGTLTVTLSDSSQNPVEGKNITVNVASSNSVEPATIFSAIGVSGTPVGTPTAATATGTTPSAGTVTFTFTALGSLTSGATFSGTLNITSDDAGNTVSVPISVTIS